MRIDRAIGRAVAFWANTQEKSERFSYVDFSPFDRKPEQEASAEDVLAFLKAASKTPK